MRWIRLSLILAAIAAVYFFRLGQPLLWADEADTGILSRNVLRSGYPTAFDGRNVSLADDGAQLNRRPPLQENPLGAVLRGRPFPRRFRRRSPAACASLFALCGLLAFFPLEAALRGRLRHPDLVAALALLTPQVVLLQRSARYYPILILLYALLLWHLSANFKERRARWASAALIFVLLFSHPSFRRALLRRARWSSIASAAAARRCRVTSRPPAPGFFPGWPGMNSSARALAATPLTLGLLTTHFAYWWKGFTLGVAATFVDTDAVGCLPLLLWAGALGYLCWRHRPALRTLAREPLVGFVLLNLARAGRWRPARSSGRKRPRTSASCAICPTCSWLCSSPAFWCSMRPCAPPAPIWRSARSRSPPIS